MGVLGFLYLILSFALLVKCISAFFSRKINSIFFMDLCMFLYYTLPGFFRCFPNLLDITNLYYEPTWTGLLLILLFYFMMVFGHYIHIPEKYELYIPKEEIKVKWLGILITVFSVMSFILFCGLYGGVKSVFSNIVNIRYGLLSSNSAKYEFISKLYNCCILAPVIMLPHWKESADRDKLTILICTVLAFLIKVSTGSRGTIVVFLGVFVIAAWISSTSPSGDRQKKPGVIIISKRTLTVLRRIVGFTIIAVLILLIYRPFLIMLSEVRIVGFSQASENFIASITSSQNSAQNIQGFQSSARSFQRNFNHYSISLESAIIHVNDGSHKMNYFLEFIAMIESIIPSMLLNVNKMLGVVTNNSKYLYEYGLGANVPPGIVASGYYSGGVFFVILYGFMTGVIGNYIDRFYRRIKNHIKFGHTYYCFILFNYWTFAGSGDFPTVFGQLFTTFIFMWIIKKQMRPLPV